MPIIKLEQADIKLYYDIFGPSIEGQPDVRTMIFIHGGPGIVDGRLYHKFWKKFASDNLRVIFVDQRGSGRSDDPKNQETLNIDQHAKDIHEFCSVLSIEKPIVAGVSQGGYVSLSYAAQFPEDLSTLIIANTEAKRDTKARCDAYKKNAVDYFGAIEEAAEEAASAVMTLDQHWTSEEWSPAGALGKIAPFFTKNAEEFIGQLHPITMEKYMQHEWGSFDLTQQLPKITCPILYLAGRYDCVHPLRCAEQTKDLLVNVKELDFQVLEAAAPVYADKEAETMVFINDFLSRFDCQKRCKFSPK